MTTAMEAQGPFSGERVAEIPLERAPLVRVLAQVRFENMAVFKRANFINPFVEELLVDYPLLEEGHETEIVVGPAGAMQQESSNPIWRLRSLDHDWVVTVSPGSLAIETRAYSSRTDFTARLRTVCDAFINRIGPSLVTRLGVRYTNQILDSAIPEERLAQFFRPDVRGPLNIPVGQTQVLHSVSDALFSEGGRSVQGRWGIIPPNALFDPTLPPVGHPTWFVDIDCFTTDRVEMTAGSLANEAHSLSERAYSLFRWLVTQDFLDHFGEKK